MVTAAISITILFMGGDGARWYAIGPACLGTFAVIQGLKQKNTSDLTQEGKAEVEAARQQDRKQLVEDIQKFLKSWLGRLLVSGTIVGGCYLYAQQGPVTADERIILLLLCAGAAIWAWQTSLALLSFGVFWWLTTLDWHLSTPAAVIIGALIIAAAIKSKS